MLRVNNEATVALHWAIDHVDVKKTLTTKFYDDCW